MITVRKVPFGKLKSIWNQFIIEGNYQQPYQLYSLNDIIRRNYLLFSLKEMEFPVFFLFYEDSCPLCIAPMCIRLFGVNRLVSFGKAPTIPIKDFIYSKEMTIDKMMFCINLLREKYSQIRFFDVPTYSLLHQALEKMTDVIKNHVYTSIFMGNGYEKYYNSLDKHMRQNIRTPYNRINRDSALLEMTIKKTIDLTSKEEDDIAKVYINRRNEHHGHVSFMHKIFLKKLHYFSIALRQLDSGLCGILRINGQIAAFWSGFISINNSYVSCPRLAINGEFDHYSPGILLLCETAKQLKVNWNLDVIDLSRGNHDYKMRMGGENYFSHDFIISN